MSICPHPLASILSPGETLCAPLQAHFVPDFLSPLLHSPPGFNPTHSFSHSTSIYLSSPYYVPSTALSMKNTEKNEINPNSALKELIQILKLQLWMSGGTHSFPLPRAHPASKHLTVTSNLTWPFGNSLEGPRKVKRGGTSLVDQWLRICLAMQGTQVQSPVWD